jgi:hypothetical protein
MQIPISLMTADLFKTESPDRRMVVMIGDPATGKTAKLNSKYLAEL